MATTNDFQRLQNDIDDLISLGLRNTSDRYREALNESRDILQKYADEYGLEFEDLQKYDRMDKLKKELGEVSRKAHVDYSQIARSSLRDAYRESYGFTQNLIEDLTGITVRGKIKREVVQQALQNPVSGLTLNDRLRSNRRRIIRDIQEAVGQGIYNGEGYQKISRRMRDTFEGNMAKAERVARTEGHRMMEQGKSDSVQRAANQGVKVEKFWIDTADDRTRDTHQELGRKYSEDNAIPIDEPFELGGMEAMFPGDFGDPAEDINCRCTVGYTSIEKE